jgi:hypothetical protein
VGMFKMGGLKRRTRAITGNCDLLGKHGTQVPLC